MNGKGGSLGSSQPGEFGVRQGALSSALPPPTGGSTTDVNGGIMADRPDETMSNQCQESVDCVVKHDEAVSTALSSPPLICNGVNVVNTQHGDEYASKSPDTQHGDEYDSKSPDTGTQQPSAVSTGQDVKDVPVMEAEVADPSQKDDPHSVTSDDTGTTHVSVQPEETVVEIPSDKESKDSNQAICESQTFPEDTSEKFSNVNNKIMETDVINSESIPESEGTLMEVEGMEQETVSNMGRSQDQEDTGISGMADSDSGPDCEAELRIEISDVRTINFDEEVDLDSSGPLAIIDLENTESQSESDSFKEDLTSPKTGSQFVPSPCNGGNIGDGEGQANLHDSLAGDASQPIPDKQQFLTQKGGNMKDHQAHPDGSTPIVNDNLTLCENLERSGDKRLDLKKCSKEELAVSKNQNAESPRIETQTSEGDILHDLYQQTSSLHDPELNTLKTSDTVGEAAKESPPTTTQASTLLSNIADAVQKIKSEPQDQGYEDALTSAQVVKVGNYTKTQDMTERFRLPVSLCSTETSNVSHTITIPSASLINTLPSPKVLPYMAMKTTVAPTVPSHVIGTTSGTPVSHAITSAAGGKEGIQTKTVALLVPLRTQGNDQGPMFVSHPTVTSKDVSCTTVQSEIATCVKVVSANSQVSNTVEEAGSFEKLVYCKCTQHEVKSIELGKVSEFLQRRNALKCYKAPKHPSFTDKKHHACPECGDSYALKNSLNLHMSRCSMVIKYHCDKCKADFQFNNKCQLLTHLRLHADTSSTCKVQPPLKINSDNLSILTPSLKELQKATERFNVPPKDPDKIMVRCLECRQVFANEKILKVHFGANELVCSFAFQCPICSKVLPRQCALNAHMKIHSRMSDYVCPECGKPFTNKSQSFVRHLNDECYHQNRIFLLQCPVCNIHLESVPKIKEHCMKEHVKTIIKCKFCKEGFQTWMLFKSHIQNTHGMGPNSEQFTSTRVCGLCAFVPTSTCLLEKHLDRHMQELKKNAKFGYQCSDCSSTKPVFATKQLLIQHMQAVHSKLQTVSCNGCDLMFSCVFALEKHRQKIHPVQPHSVKHHEHTKVTYQCGKCKVKNSSVAALKKHDCKPQSTSTAPITVAMCARCKSIMASDYSKHKCPMAAKSPDKLPSLTKGPTKPFPVQLITISKQAIIQVRENKKKDFSCNYCKKWFDSAGDLAVHLQSCEDALYVQRTPKTPLKSNLSSSQYVFSCNLCHVRFPSRDRLLIHIQDHSNKGDKVCTVCNIMAFKTEIQLKGHVPSCKGPDVVADPHTKVQCRVCSQYIQRVHLKNHVLTHMSKGKMMCRHCQRMDFQDREELQSHEYACGFADYPLEHNYCYVCARTFVFLEQLVCHLQQHVKEGTLVCCKCQKTEFATKEELKAHHDTCGQDYMNILPGEMCSLCRCSLQYRPKNYLHRHITQHVTKGALICCRCQKMGWDSFGEVKSHQIGCGMFTENCTLSRQDQDRKCVCTICNKDCTDMNALIVHLKRHVANGQLICTKCQKRGWKNASTLMNHEMTCGVTLAKPVKASYKTMDHVCEHCGKMFRKFHLLQEHVRKEHVSFPCHLCGLSYDTKSALVSHVSVVHDGKRSFFTCSICKQKKLEKSFASQLGLEKHMRKMHRHHRRHSDSSDVNNADSQSRSNTRLSKPSSPPPVKRLRVEGDSVYTCAKCPVIMEDAAEFAEHIKEHNSDNTNQCPDCGLCFTILATLKKHLFLVHKVRDSDKYLQDRGLKTEEEEIISDSEELSPPPVKRNKWMNHSMALRKSSNPLECTVCSRTFDTDRQLKTHMRIHGMAFLCSNKRAGSVKSSPDEDSGDVSPTKSSGSSCSDTKISDSAGSQDMEQERETDLQNISASPLTEAKQQTQSLVKVKQEPMDYD